MMSFGFPVDPWLERMSPIDPEIPAPEDACYYCGYNYGEPLSECEGVEGECAKGVKWCGHCTPEGCTGDPRCADCEAAFNVEIDRENLGLRFEMIAERETECAACGKWAHRSQTPATWCAECGHPTCGECLRVGDDKKPRCAECAKEMVGL